MIISTTDEKYRTTRSSDGYYIRKVGTNEIYTTAIDWIDSPFEYEETDEKIPKELIELEQHGIFTRNN